MEMTLEFHEVAYLFPEMPQDEYQSLVDDIRSRGLLEPIWKYENKIIDGRHRYRACLETNITPRFREWDGAGSLVMFVVSLNLKRRHLNSSQKAVLALEVEKLLAVEAKQNLITSTGGSTPQPLEKILKPDPIHAAKQAAQSVGTNQHYVNDAKRIAEQAPDVLEAVRHGIVNIPEGKKLARQDMATRQSVLQGIKAGTTKNVKSALAQKRIAEIETAPITVNIPANVTVIQADMLTVDLDIKVDCLIADPPYNVTEWAWDRLPEFIETTRQWLIKCQTWLAPEYHLFWCCSPQYMADIEMIIRDLHLPIQSRLVWHRRNMSMGSDSRYRFIDSWECIFHVGTKNMNFSAKWSDERFDVQTFAVPQTNFSDAKMHPTQKPLDLIRWMIRNTSQPTDLILDPFAGSGTTGHAAILENRQCILIERESSYINVIHNRLNTLE